VSEFKPLGYMTPAPFRAAEEAYQEAAKRVPAEPDRDSLNVDADKAELRAEVERLRGEEVGEALAGERAKVARIEALIGNWESMAGTPESEAWVRYVAGRVRNALSGDYSSETEAAGP
jgi:hypothetical protein